MQIDVLIFGGGVAGLWLLDELHRRSVRALLVEANALGAGQTVASQGIIHGGLKYSLAGALTSSARGVREMPARWRASLSGEVGPDLRDVRVLSPCCYMWRTEGLTSRAGLTAARVALRTPAQGVDVHQRPEALRSCPGEVFRVEEQVIDVVSLLKQLAHLHTPRMIRVPSDTVAFSLSPDGMVERVQLCPKGGGRAEIAPRTVVLAAGAGNEDLRVRLGLDPRAMQRRPLHMVMARGPLPPLYGHCVDGMHTRVTITTHFDSRGRSVWQIGGEVAERGAGMNSRELIDFARNETESVLPGIDMGAAQWATYRIDRAEGRTAAGQRPEGPTWSREANVITAWPTKLALAPQLAGMIADELGTPRDEHPDGFDALADWPRPAPALPPWEGEREWSS